MPLAATRNLGERLDASLSSLLTESLSGKAAECNFLHAAQATLPKFAFGGRPATKQLALAAKPATGVMKPIDSKSIPAQNVAALLAAALWLGFFFLTPPLW